MVNRTDVILAVGDEPREAEVAQHHAPVDVDEEVPDGDVAMNDLQTRHGVICVYADI